jgi:hypothetical protein
MLLLGFASQRRLGALTLSKDEDRGQYIDVKVTQRRRAAASIGSRHLLPAEYEVIAESALDACFIC